MKLAPHQRSSRRSPPSQVAPLRVRLAEAEATLLAIRSGEVDAVMVEGKDGPQVFTLDGAGHAYRVLIESMHEGALTLTTDMVVLYANQCFARMVRCPLEQVIGCSFGRFLSAADQATLRPVLEQPKEPGVKFQMPLMAGDGSHLPAQISIRSLTRNGSDRVTFGLVVTDMTDARRAAEQEETARLYAQAREHAAELERRVEERTRQLLDANRELEAFESSVSHDLRGPLRHIMQFSQMLIEGYAAQLPDEARGCLTRIHESVGKMEAMILALLAFSRLGKQSLSRQPVDVSGMWHEILAEIRPGLGERPIEVTIGDLPPCDADPVLLRQVLVNLLENALKYSRTRDCSVIEISTGPPLDDGSTVYSIKDNGVGFDMAKADKLFAVFERLHDASEFEGTGVGLTTVQRIIQRHGGRIWAEAAQDVGATFFFTVGLPPASSVDRLTGYC